MKLCVLGPRGTAVRTGKIVQENFSELDAFVVEYDWYTDVPDLIDGIQKSADMILFPGKAAYSLCEKHKIPQIPWEYIPRHSSSLMRALLEVQQRYKRDLCRISYDTLPQELILKTYQEIGNADSELHIFVAEQRLLDPRYLSYLVKFHQDNYLHHGASCCITGLTEIGVQLRQMGIPSVITLPPSALIIDTVKRLQLRYQAQMNLENQIVVLSVELGFAGEHSILGKDDYIYITNRIKVLECIYQFSYRVEGVVVESSYRNFLIFTTKRSIELETEYFKSLYLLELLNTCHAKNVSVGIGYGTTANEAKFNAFDAMEMARKTQDNCAYVILEDGTVLKHLVSGRKDAGKSEQVDQNLTRLAEQTNLGADTLHTIWSKTVKSGRSEFTSRELAGICGLNIRTVDRILQKLLAAECCEVVGMRMVCGHGRPSRIFKFYWFD